MGPTTTRIESKLSQPFECRCKIRMPKCLIQFIPAWGWIKSAPCTYHRLLRQYFSAAVKHGGIEEVMASTIMYEKSKINPITTHHKLIIAAREASTYCSAMVRKRRSVLSM